MSSYRRSTPLRIGLIDMNNGVANQAIRSFHALLGSFIARAQAVNPGLEARVIHVQPRNLAEQPPAECDLYLSTGGPDSPVDGFQESWCPPVRTFLDGIVEAHLTRGTCAPRLLAVCYSFEIAVLHFGIASLEPRQRKFGIMPVYPTPEGMRSELLGAFGDRLFAWEHRNWEAVDLDVSKLERLGGQLYARESRDGVSKGRGLMAFRFAPGIEGTIFHPEADRPGVLNWIERPEQARAVVEAYGEQTYQRMLKTLDDPSRLARTYALLIPGWLARNFNVLAPEQGWAPVPLPAYDSGGIEGFVHPGESRR